MQRHKTIMTICSAAVLSFGLAACGGGGGDGDTTGTPPPPPTTYTVALPDGHGLMAGTTMLAHGDTVVGDTTISCPSANGCALTVSKDPVTGAYTATATGGQVMVAVAEPPPPPAGPDPMVLADARDAARDAWRDARAELAKVAGKESADPAAYQRAVDAVADARAAYDAAVAATTEREAEDARDEARDALQMAIDRVAQVIYAYDKPMIVAARNAAKSAADAAKTAYDAAKAALAEVESIKGIDMASYDTAVAKVAAAKAAYDAAKAASDAAAAAMLLAEAQAQRDAARTASDDAATANTDAMKYAGMVQSAEDSALSAAKSDAQTAYDAAKSAYDAAKMRVAALETEDENGRAKKDDNVEDHVRATDALAEVKMAYDAAKAANEMAQAATLSTEARGHADEVETQKAAVDTEKEDVDRLAMLVETAYDAAQRQRNTDEQNRLAEEQRVKDLETARGNAMQSYMDAKADADKAKTAADAAEAAAPGSPGAMAAKEAYEAAKMAADAAKAAHDAITDEMTKAQADAKAADAATAARTANNEYMTANRQNEAIQTIVALQNERDRQDDIRMVNAAVMAAETAKDEADQAADDAEQARDDALAALNKARAARTDATTAEAEYEKAKAAATAARTAADNAETAYEAAKMAAEGIDDDTAEDVKTALMTAETQKGTAETEKGKAETEKGKAETARTEAMMASSMPTLGLLKAANAVDVEDVASTTDVNEQAEAIKAVANAVAGAAGSGATGDDADNDSRTGPTAVTATATWNANTAANPDATPPTPEVPMYLSVTVTNVGDDIVADAQGTDANDDGDTADVGDTAPNAKSIDGLPGFSHGFDITVTDATNARDKHVIVFTDKQQATLLVPAKTTTVANLPVQLGRIKERPTSDTDPTPITVTGALTTLGDEVNYDHDGDPATMAIQGTFACQGDDATCVLQVTDGKLVAIEGDIRFSTSTPQTIVAEVPADTMANYLVFGVWLDEDSSTDTGEQPAFGAFASGGAAVAGDLTPVEGTATYEGAAAGVRATSSAVDFFSADALLTANFGEDDAPGTVSGRIHNIVAGGEDVPHDIYLGQSPIGTTGNGALAGNTWMGDVSTGETGATFPLNGRWSGGFYNPATGDDDSPDLTEAPGSIAGTFGVTMADDADTENVNEQTSFVGAFGAHKQ